MTDPRTPANDPMPYQPGKAYPDWDCLLTPDYQAAKLACCNIDPALYGDRADITHYAFAAIMSVRRAGISINGRVHMTQSFDLSEPILLGESLRVQGRTVEITPDRRGHIISDQFEFVRPDGSVPLRAERQSLRLDPSLSDQNRPSGPAKRTVGDATAGMLQIDEKQLEPEKVAAYSDEAENLIHSDPETAKRFGYRAPIAAGLMAIRCMMAALSKESPPDRLKLHIRFRRPMFWDERLGIWARFDEDDPAHIRNLAVVKEDGRVASEGVVEKIIY